LRRVAVVIPCFDEAARLDAEAIRRARLGGKKLELILVDDGSRDGTRAALERIASERADTRLLRIDRNVGKGEAVRRGVLDALARSPDAVGYWDADLSPPLSSLSAFARVLEQDPNVEMVFGSRVRMMGRRIERLAWRHYLGRVFATAASMALELPIYDTQCGAKLFRSTPLLARVFARPWMTRWVFDVEIVARFMAFDPRGPQRVMRSLHELPLAQWVHVGGSKVAPLDFARAAMDLARIRAAYRTPATFVRSESGAGPRSTRAEVTGEAEGGRPSCSVTVATSRAS
jgi:glycosyltransferase involved in cell wall biosynthesis